MVFWSPYFMEDILFYIITGLISLYFPLITSQSCRILHRCVMVTEEVTIATITAITTSSNIADSLTENAFLNLNSE